MKFKKPKIVAKMSKLELKLDLSIYFQLLAESKKLNPAPNLKSKSLKSKKKTKILRVMNGPIN